MFDIGFTELLLIAVVALIVLGPERLPKAAQFAGLWVRRARAQWYSVKSELERELAAEELKRSVREAQQSIADVGTQLRDAGTRVREGVEQARRETEDLVETARRMPGEPVREAVDPLPEGAIAADPTTPPTPAPSPTLPQESGDGAAR